MESIDVWKLAEKRTLELKPKFEAIPTALGFGFAAGVVAMVFSIFAGIDSGKHQTAIMWVALVFGLLVYFYLRSEWKAFYKAFNDEVKSLSEMQKLNSETE